MAAPTTAEQQPAEAEPLRQQARRALREHDVAKAKDTAHFILAGSGCPDDQNKQTESSLLREPGHLDTSDTCIATTDSPADISVASKISTLDIITAYSVLALTADDIDEAGHYAELGLDESHLWSGSHDIKEIHEFHDASQPILRVMKFGWKKFDPSETEGPCDGEGPCVCGWLGQKCPDAVYIAQGHRASGSFDGVM